MEVQKINDNIIYLVFLGSFGGLLLASSVIFMYMRYQRRFLQQQAAQQEAELEHRRQLMYATIQSQESERIRISRDLHDHIGSSLSKLRFMVARIKQADAGTLQTMTEECKGSIDAIIGDVRNISHSLSPAGLSLWGLQDTLEEFCSQISQSSGLDILVADHSDACLKHLPFEEALSLFRVIQELVTNTIKHAAAKKVTINISKDHEVVTLQYVDDGKGVNAANIKGQGIGLYNIESRLDMIGAMYEVVSAPGAGYTFTIRLALNKLNKIIAV